LNEAATSPFGDADLMEEIATKIRAAYDA